MSFQFSKLFASATVSVGFDAHISEQAMRGRVAHAFVQAVKTDYSADVPVSKKEFLAFRTRHVAYASATPEARSLMAQPTLWVKGHVKRAGLFEALDAIASGLTGSMPVDTADWVALFAPVKKAAAPAPAQAAAPAAAPAQAAAQAPITIEAAIATLQAAASAGMLTQAHQAQLRALQALLEPAML